MSADEFCRDCDLAFHSDGPGYECRAKPPFVKLRKRMDADGREKDLEHFPVWPIVRGDDWCGDWRIRKRHAPTKVAMDYRDLFDLGFTPRTLNALTVDKVLTVRDLCGKSESELLKIPNLGRKSLADIRVTLAYWGLSLPRAAPLNKSELAALEQRKNAQPVVDEAPRKD